MAAPLVPLFLRFIAPFGLTKVLNIVSPAAKTLIKNIVAKPATRLTKTQGKTLERARRDITAVIPKAKTKSIFSIKEVGRKTPIKGGRVARKPASKPDPRQLELNFTKPPGPVIRGGRVRPKGKVRLAKKVAKRIIKNPKVQAGVTIGATVAASLLDNKQQVVAPKAQQASRAVETLKAPPKGFEGPFSGNLAGVANRLRLRQAKGEFVNPELTNLAGGKVPRSEPRPSLRAAAGKNAEVLAGIRKARRITGEALAPFAQQQRLRQEIEKSVLRGGGSDTAVTRALRKRLKGKVGRSTKRAISDLVK